MNIIRHFQSFATRVLNPSRWLAAAKRKAIRVEVAAISLLLMPVILVVADRLPFVDVPSGAFYHNAVSALFGARIMTGTTPTTFSPEDLVTRGQMAVFLHRGLGRIAYDTSYFSAVNLGTDEVDLAVISRFATGEIPGGTGFVKLDGVVTSQTQSDSTTGCPCILYFYIVRDGGGISPTNITNLYDGREGVPGSVNGAVTWAVSVPTGTSPTFRLRARFGISVQRTANYTYGTLTAIYAPFGHINIGPTRPSSQEESEETIPNSQ